MGCHAGNLIADLAAFNAICRRNGRKRGLMQTKNYKFWFCTGSQDLYGDECLRKVADHSAKIVEGLNASGKLPFEVVLKPTLISQASIRKTFNDANNDPECAGVKKIF